MTQATSPRLTALLAFLAGAAAGAVVVALTTPKSGPQLRSDLAGLGPRLKTKADHLALRGTRALEAFKAEIEDPHPETGQDLRGQAAGVWQDAKVRAEALAREAGEAAAAILADGVSQT